MRQKTLATLAIAAAVHAFASLLSAQTLNGSAFALRSTGAASGGDWTLSANGYVGTYITLGAPGTVSFNMQASGVSSPRMNLAVGDAKVGFDVAGGFNAYRASVPLPAGTHFVRLEYNNDTPGVANRALTLRNVQIEGATVANTSTNANALNAADTYIANYRKGSATVALTGPGGIPLLGGQAVDVSLARHAFNFGTAVPGSSTASVNSYLGATGTTKQAQYQARLNQNFNAIVPENAGKWAYSESTRDVNTTGAIDAMLNYAQGNGMRARMHNLIWGDNSNNGQQPSWVLNNNAPPSNGLLDKAYLGDVTAKNDLRAEISERIGYYVGTGSATDRARKYVEIDVYNESVHTGSAAPSSPTDLRHNYWNVYGATGVADIYRETIAAINASGATAKVFVNEYNVLDDNGYANYFVQNIEAIRNAGVAAGYGDVVQGIGAQYYPSSGTHNAAKAMANFQNLAVQGLPIALTEFGAQSSLSTSAGATILGEMLRLTFGNAESTGFFLWGFHQESGSGATTLFAPQAALYTVNTANFNEWTLTEAGRKWQDQLGIADWDGNVANGWSTHLTPTVGPDGTIAFHGFFGDYDIAGQSGAMTLAKGVAGYSLSLAAPPDWMFWKTDASGAWTDSARWTNAVANGIGTTAHFGAAAGARSISVDADIVVGQINFISAANYQVAGAGRITLDANGSNATRLNVLEGAHVIATRLEVRDALEVRVDTGAALTLAGDLVSAADGLGLTKRGDGLLTIRAARFEHVSIAAGTLRTTSATSRMRSLDVGSAALIDIGTTTWVLDYEGTSPIDATRALFIASRGTGDWIGVTGITSSMLDPAFQAIGYAEASELDIASFAGEDLDSSAIVFRVATLGDANLDGRVGFDDLLRLAQRYESPASGLHWSDGDFDYDGIVGFDDLLVLAQHYGESSLYWARLEGDASFAADWRLALSIVPEPHVISILGLTAAIAVRRR